MARYLIAAVALVAVIVARPGAARAELKPEEIAIIAARGNRESESLAKYYAKARGIPSDHICLVDFPKGEVLSNKDWTWAVRPEIHKWIDENDPGVKLRCLVTTWGVPLKISPAEVDASLRRHKTYLQEERAARLKVLEDAIAAFDQLAPEKKPATEDEAASAEDEASSAEDKAKSADKAGSVAKSQLDRFRERLETSLRGSQRRIGDLPVGAEKLEAQQRLQQLVTVTGGVGVVTQGLAQQLASKSPPDPALVASFQNLRGVQAAWTDARAFLEQSAPSIDRDSKIIAILERLGGQLAVIPWLDEEIANIDRNETGASFDSELSLIMWPDDYQLLRWQPNYLRAGYDASQLRKAFRTLMVSRIDAPTIELAKGLIDTAIKVEKEGLKGKAYFDARGLAKLEDSNVGIGSYEDYDRALLLTAKGIHDQTNLGMTLNDKPELFQKGDCPDAALYCGWYSLAKYVDAFDWVPGAVAYHLASNEAQTLHDPKSREWCKSLLADGVCATIGPVYEPYLVAFPRPEEFFALLLQGKLSLVECYYRTAPFNSWMMTLIGDPLYTPFKNNPAIGLKGPAPTTVQPVAPATSAAPAASDGAK